MTIVSLQHFTLQINLNDDIIHKKQKRRDILCLIWRNFSLKLTHILLRMTSLLYLPPCTVHALVCILDQFLPSFSKKSLYWEYEHLHVDWYVTPDICGYFHMCPGRSQPYHLPQNSISVSNVLFSVNCWTLVFTAQALCNKNEILS